MSLLSVAEEMCRRRVDLPQPDGPERRIGDFDPINDSAMFVMFDRVVGVETSWETLGRGGGEGG